MIRVFQFIECLTPVANSEVSDGGEGMSYTEPPPPPFEIILVARIEGAESL